MKTQILNQWLSFKDRTHTETGTRSLIALNLKFGHLITKYILERQKYFLNLWPNLNISIKIFEILQNLKSIFSKFHIIIR